jgi:hypothetical protein
MDDELQEKSPQELQPKPKPLVGIELDTRDTIDSIFGIIQPPTAQKKE